MDSVETVENTEVKLTHRQKRLARIKKRLFKEDIKYEGPLSYRVLRVLAWIFLALGQVVVCMSLFNKISGWDPLGEGWRTAFSILSNLSTPFFIIASFGLALSGHKNVRDFMLVYGLAYLAIGGGFIFFYTRYVNGLFVELGVQKADFVDVFENFVSDKVQINVFADLFAFALFHFFLNYSPKKVFTGKLLIIFRLFAILPIAFAFGSYIIYVLASYDIIDVTLYVYVFLTTKSPLVFLVFVAISLWIKYRERLFLRLGATKEEFQEFLNTRRNSLSVSLHLSFFIVVFAVIDLFCIIFIMIIHAALGMLDNNFPDLVVSHFKAGETSAMLLAVPFILLYSYKLKHKDSRIDIILPLAGIGLVVLTYLECIYQFIIYFVGD